MYGYIYMITNLVTNKSYIGKHKYDKPCLDEKYVCSGTLINKSINKYGIDKFERKLIATADTAQELNDLEISYIDKFNTRVPNGYNLTRGGDGLCDPSPEVRKKLDVWSGKKQPASMVEKRRQSCKQVVHTPEWIAKISAANKGQVPSELCIAANKKRKTNSKWYNNGQEEHMFLGDDIPEGYVKGRLKNPFPDQRGKPKSKEAIEKISLKLKGTKWFNNGTIEKLCSPDNVPEGFVKGRLKKNLTAYS